MGSAALKSMGDNPKPTGSFRPKAEGTEKFRNFTQTKGVEMSTVGRSDDLATVAQREKERHTLHDAVLDIE